MYKQEKSDSMFSQLEQLRLPPSYRDLELAVLTTKISEVRSMKRELLPVLDLRDTLSPVSESDSKPFPLVADALREVLRSGPVVILTGDTWEVAARFLEEAGLLIESIDGRNFSEVAAGQLTLLCRSGMDVISADEDCGLVRQRTFLKGMTPMQVRAAGQVIRTVIERWDAENAPDFMPRDSSEEVQRIFVRGPFTERELPLSEWEERYGDRNDDSLSLRVRPCGRIPNNLKPEFHERNASKLMVLLDAVNRTLQVEGLGEIEFILGGTTGIDGSRVTKGRTLAQLESIFPKEQFAYVAVGDQFQKGGIDESMATQAEICVDISGVPNKHFRAGAFGRPLALCRPPEEGSTAEVLYLCSFD